MDYSYWMDQDASGAWRSHPSLDPPHSLLLEDFAPSPVLGLWIQDPNTSINLANHCLLDDLEVSYARPTRDDFLNDGGRHVDLPRVKDMPHQSYESFIEEGTQSRLNNTYATSETNVTRGTGEDCSEVSNQKTFICKQCDAAETSRSRLHQHLATHGHFCNECNQSFNSHWYLNRHALETSHQAYLCTECDASFSRLDVLGRHRQEHQPAATIYSCDHCKKWRAPNGFKRKDHLTQHLRNYHHLQIDVQPIGALDDWESDKVDDPGFRKHCVHEGCTLFRATCIWHTPALFPTRSAFTAHMKNEHDESLYPCTEPGCSRINGKGFFRKRDLMKHIRRVHETSNDPDAETLPQANAPSQPNTVPNGQQFLLDVASNNTDTMSSVEAAMDVLRAKGYIVQKDPGFAGPFKN